MNNIGQNLFINLTKFDDHSLYTITNGKLMLNIIIFVWHASIWMMHDNFTTICISILTQIIQLSEIYGGPDLNNIQSHQYVKRIE